MSRDQKDTKQIIALWSAAVEEKIAATLAPVLERLALRAGVILSAEQAGALSHPVAQALQIAAAKGGGPQAAIDYLSQAAGEDEREPMTPSGR